MDNKKNKLKSFNNEDKVLINDSALSEIQKALSEASQNTSQILDSINNSFVNCFSDILKQYDNSYLENITPALDAFAAVLSKINLSGYTEDEKKQITNNYLIFGKYGWVLPPNVTISDFNIEVNNIKEADEYVIKEFYKNGVDDVLVPLSKFKIKKDDLNEAISCYKNKEYRACALIIFSLIDNKLIITQKIRKDEIRVGNKAIDKLSKYNKNSFVKDYKYKYFVFRGVIGCLKAYYENDNGFKRKYVLCNRNHLVHGRYSKRVTELDCIKLFNLLWGLYFVL